jgi:hypothetical protein
VKKHLSGFFVVEQIALARAADILTSANSKGCPEYVNRGRWKLPPDTSLLLKWQRPALKAGVRGFMRAIEIVTPSRPWELQVAWRKYRKERKSAYK